MAAQTLILQNPAVLHWPATVLSRPPIPSTTPRHLSKPRTVSLQSTPSLPLRDRFMPATIRASSPSTPVHIESPTRSLLTGSTRTVSTLLAIALTASKFFADKVLNFALPLKGFHSGLSQSLVNSAGPAFFAAMRDQSVGTLNTPFTVVAAGMAKWLDIYSGVLMVRVLLSWFPNIPWDRQPFSAVRDLCDPYLNLFRNIIPPIFDTLDVSPLLAFAVLGTLGSILKSSKGGF